MISQRPSISSARLPSISRPQPAVQSVPPGSARCAAAAAAAAAASAADAARLLDRAADEAPLDAPQHSQPSGTG